MKIRPLHDRAVVRRAEGEQQTASALYIPDTAQEKQARRRGRRRWPRPDERQRGRPRLTVAAGDRSCSASTRGPRSSSTAKNSLSCVKMTFSQWSMPTLNA